MLRDELMARAVAYARYGFAVFPCEPRSKLPAVNHWREWSTRSLEVIEWFWWTGEYNIAIDCAKSRLLIPDLDNKDGLEGERNYRQWEIEHDVSPTPTTTVRTPSGGLHIYYQRPEGCEYGNSSRDLPPGVDIRGAGGYVLAPGSVLENGRYETETKAPIVDAPPQLLEALKAPEVERRAFTGKVRPERAYSFCRSHMAKFDAGSHRRNDELFAMARWLGKFGELPEAERREVLLEAGMAVGLSERECLATIASGFKAAQTVSL